MLKKILLASTVLAFGQTAYSQTSVEKTTGYTNITELNFTRWFASQIQNNSNVLVIATGKYPYTYGIQTINGYKFNDKLVAGLGLGYDRNQLGGSSLPVFADLRVSFGQKKIRPFFDQNVGFAFDLFNHDFQEIFKSRGSYFLGSSFGYAFPCSFAQSINLSLGYRGKYRKTELYFPGVEGSFKTFDHILTLKAGLSF